MIRTNPYLLASFLFYFTVFLSLGCDKKNIDPRETDDRLSANYELTIEGETFTFDEATLNYDFCDDVSFRPIGHSKDYIDSTVIYVASFLPYQRVENQKVGYDFYTYWHRFSLPDMSFREAVEDAMNGNTQRKLDLRFSIKENDTFYANLQPIGFPTPRLIDQNSVTTLDITFPEVDCRLWGPRIGEADYTYSGYVYTRDLSDSLYVDQFTLKLWIPLIL